MVIVERRKTMKKKRTSVLVIFVLVLSMLSPDISVKASDYPSVSGIWQYTENSDGTVTIVGTSKAYGKLNLPSIISGKNVAKIGDEVFLDGSGMTGVLVIPEGVKSIGNSTFSGCSGLTGMLVIPEETTSIGNSAFLGCSGLTGDLVIPEGVTKIENSVFQECSGFSGELIIPQGITSIGNSAFLGCSGLTGDLVIPKGVQSIGNSAFLGCNNITGKLVLSEGLEKIGSSAFSRCSGLTGDLVIPEGVINIGSSAFLGCKNMKGKLTISQGVTSIGSSAFSRCSGLTGKLIIPEGVTDVGSYAFSYCKNLTSAEIPSTLTKMQTGMFKGCTGLEEVIIPSNVTDISDDTFEGCDLRKLVIIAEKGSAAETFAKNNNITVGNIDTNISLSEEIITLNLKSGQTATLTAIVQNADAADIKWSSLDETVAIVDGGVVIPKGVGVTFVLATVNGRTAKCKVIVETQTEPVATPPTEPSEAPSATPIPEPSAAPSMTPPTEPSEAPSTIPPTMPSVTQGMIQNKDTISSDSIKKNGTQAIGRVNITSIKRRKSKVIISWKKISKARYYQIEYALDKKFKKSKKRIKVLTTKCSIKKVKKKYYFRVRACGKQSGKIIIGKWSKVKSK